MSDDLNKLDYDVSYGADFQERKVEVIDVYEKKNDIPYAIYYPYPLNKQPAFKKYSTEKFVESEKLSKTVISLPIGRNVDDSVQLKIAEIINKSS